MAQMVDAHRNRTVFVGALHQFLRYATILSLLVVFAGCDGFSTGDGPDGPTDPPPTNQVTIAGILFDNRFSDELTPLPWYGTEADDGEYVGFPGNEGFISRVSWTRDTLVNPGLEDNDLPVQIYRTQIFDETGRLWRDYRQTIARAANAAVYLLDYQELFLDQQRSYTSQPQLLFPSRADTIEDTIFTDGLGYRWRIESTEVTSPNGFSDCRRLVPLSTENSAAVQPGRVVQHTGDMYYNDEAGLVYVSEYDFSFVGVNVQPEPTENGFSFIADGGSNPNPDPTIVTLDGITFSSETSNELAVFAQLGNLSSYVVRGYGGELPSEELRVTWSQRNVSVVQENDRVVLPVWLQTITSRDLADSDSLSVVQSEQLIARAENGDAYVLASDPDDDRVTGLASTDIFARGNIALDDTWRQSDGRTYRVQSTNPSTNSPSGHDELTLILAVTADQDGPIDSGEQPRRYYDAAGYAEESIQGVRGRYRTGSGIAPPVTFSIAGVAFELEQTHAIEGLPQLGDLSSYAVRGYGGIQVGEQRNYSWVAVDLSVVADDGLSYDFPAWRRDVLYVDLTDPDFPQRQGPSEFVARAENGDVYALAVTNGAVQGLVSEAVFARGSVALGDTWVQSDGRGYRVLSTSPISASPSGHAGLRYILEVVTDGSGGLVEADRPRLYFDAIGFAEESVRQTRGTYRIGEGIVPPESPEENVEVTLDGVAFSSASSDQLAGLPQLGTLADYVVRGYGGDLNSVELLVAWQRHSVAVAAGPQADSLPVWQLTVQSRDLASPDTPLRPFSQQLVGLAEDGNAYALAVSEDGVLTGLASPFVFARGTIAPGDSWQQSDGRTYEALNLAANASSPSGYEDLTYLLEVTADESGALAVAERSRVYFDTTGFAEESIQATRGRYRSGDGILPPIFRLSGVEFRRSTLADLQGLPQLGDLTPATFRGYGGLLPAQQQARVWEQVEVQITSDDSLVYPVVVWRYDIRHSSLSEETTNLGDDTMVYLMLGTDGHAYDLAVFDGLADALESSLIYARGAIAVGDEWLQSDGRRYRALPVEQAAMSPSGHRDITYILQIMADQTGSLAESNRPVAYFDRQGLAEEAHPNREGIYRIGAGIEPPAPPPVVISGVTFDRAEMASLAGFPQLGGSRSMDAMLAEETLVYGYGDYLPGQQLTWAWEMRSVLVAQEDEEVAVEVLVRTELIRDISDPEVEGPQTLGTDIYLARASDGNVYRLLFNAEDRVNRLQQFDGEVVLWAQGALRIGETWLQAESFGDMSLVSTYTVITEAPRLPSPTGHDNLQLIIGDVNDPNQRLYYDSFGFTDYANGERNGVFRQNADDADISPPTVAPVEANG